MESICPEEILARFIFSDKHYSKNSGRVKYAAFMPPKGIRKISVSRSAGLTERQIWEIGRGIGLAASRPLKARADIEAMHVLEAKSSIEPTSEPPRHANIILPEALDEQKLIAMELAKKSRLELNTSST